uniref:Uncharacterized protein n=1 Tax=Anguilla anguilla TaxID=7936 RepID=A0A0E9VWD5_ANGAN
MTVSQRYLN